MRLIIELPNGKEVWDDMNHTEYNTFTKADYVIALKKLDDLANSYYNRSLFTTGDKYGDIYNALKAKFKKTKFTKNENENISLTGIYKILKEASDPNSDSVNGFTSIYKNIINESLVYGTALGKTITNDEDLISILNTFDNYAEMSDNDKKGNVLYSIQNSIEKYTNGKIKPEIISKLTSTGKIAVDRYFSNKSVTVNHETEKINETWFKLMNIFRGKNLGLTRSDLTIKNNGTFQLSLKNGITGNLYKEFIKLYNVISIIADTDKLIFNFKE